MSTQEYLEKKFPKQESTFRTIEDKEIELEMEKIDREVEHLIHKKVKDFSFHIKEEMDTYPDIEKLTEVIDKSVADYKMAKKFNQIDDIKKYKVSIKEMKFAREHLMRVMNMDFTRPT